MRVCSRFDNPRSLPIAEVEYDGAGTICLFARRDAGEFEVAALGTNGGSALRIVERIILTEEEDALVIGIKV